MAHRLGVDIGGTFTDFVTLDPATGSVAIAKVRTTPRSPADAVLRGTEMLASEHGVTLSDTSTLIHATTLVTNAVIERKGARVGLIVTGGFRDILENRREERYDVYDLFLRFPKPLVPRRLRIGIGERTLRTGEALTPVSHGDVLEAIDLFRASGVESVAVCLLHSYRNGAHEEEVAGIFAEGLPEVPVSLSSEVMPEIGEYERMVVTTLNAYVQPLVERYLADLEQRLRTASFGGSLYVMLSNGGISTIDVVSRQPVRMIESGPAAGVLCAECYGRETGVEDLISFDMGGTTAKIGVIDKGEPLMAPGFEVDRVYRFKKGSGLPVRVPVVDAIEIGAGGGSIAHVNDAQLLQIGPESASAEPGPACYGLGGIDATVTDANLVMGLLSPSFFLGGKMALDLEAAEASIANDVAQPLGLSNPNAAWGIHSTVNENMVGALRVHLAEKGKDPTRYTLMAFGGCGPLHAVKVARALDISEVMIPLGAGVASALGAVLAAPAYDLAHSYVARLAGVAWDELEALFAEMETAAAAVLEQAGVGADAITFKRSADMRYEGQVYDIEVPIPSALSTASEAEVQTSFDAEYQSRYERLYAESIVQVTTCRLRALGPRPEFDLGRLRSQSKAADSVEQAVKGRRRLYESPDVGWVATPVYDRYLLAPGMRIAGPAIVEERESTSVLWSGDTAEIDELYNLRIHTARKPVAAVTVGAVDEKGMD